MTPPGQSTRQYVSVFSGVQKTFIKELRGFDSDFPVVNSCAQVFESLALPNMPIAELIPASYRCHRFAFDFSQELVLSTDILLLLRVLPADLSKSYGHEVSKIGELI